MILFISDLHLSFDKPEITRRFLGFLESRAMGAEALYILGDLFDAWIGDDDPTPPNRKISRQIKKLTDTGTKVFLQLGNRDFLLGERFCQETGVKLLGDFEVIDLYGAPTLLTHGDLLCTDDLPYQAFRAKSHTPEWMQSVLNRPLLLRLLAARWYRLRSFWRKRKKSLGIMDVNQQTVIQVMKEHGCQQLIHGHTHRPDVHVFEIDGNTVLRFVLAAWSKEAGQALCWTPEGYRIETI